MMSESSKTESSKTESLKNGVDRRNFLKGAGGGATAALAIPALAFAQQQASRPPADSAHPSEAAPAPRAATASARIVERPGSDFMLDVLKSLDITYVCANPGSSFDSLHESVINYGGNKMPEFLTCCHEEAAVAMGHGYFKIEGKPIMMLLEGAVGLQHASMAIYNAYADRVPVYIVVGNYADDLRRAPGAETYHSGIDLGGLVRDYVKWDDQPYSLGHFANSAVRAYKIAMSAPMGPVLLVANHEIQSAPQNEPRLRIPKLTLTTPPLGIWPRSRRPPRCS